MSDVAQWVSRYWKILVVLGGILFWAGRLDMKVENLDAKVDRLEAKVDRLEAQVDRLGTKVDRLEAKVDRVIGILLEVDDGKESGIAQGSGSSGRVHGAGTNP